MARSPWWPELGLCGEPRISERAAQRTLELPGASLCPGGALVGFVLFADVAVDDS